MGGVRSPPNVPYPPNRHDAITPLRDTQRTEAKGCRRNGLAGRRGRTRTQRQVWRAQRPQLSRCGRNDALSRREPVTSNMRVPTSLRSGRARSSIRDSMTTRPTIPTEIETDVLLKSARRCSFCFGLSADLRLKKGQIAHVNQNAEDTRLENLCFLCQDHHDEYDSTTSQTKGLTANELRRYRQKLYDIVATGTLPESAPKAVPPALAGASARLEACVAVEREAGALVERLCSHARFENEKEALWATVKLIEDNIGLLRRDQALTQAIRDFAHQCKILIHDNGIFDRPRERMSELDELRGYFQKLVDELDRFDALARGQIAG